VLLVLPGCRKSKVIDDRSFQETLLQNKWKPTAIWNYFPNGKKFQLIPYASLEFTPDGKKIAGIYDNFPTPHMHYHNEGYQLLPDDSTLLIYPVNDGIPSLIPDTTYLIKLTSHELVYYLVKNKFIWGVDSLKR
jgi:uncharacterized protein YbaR (Trm112 family)